MTQEEALTILKTGANVFLTGEPGSGKTHTVNRYVQWLREHGVEPSITASTGIAATHIGGYTIHSWSGIGIRRFLSAQDLDTVSQNKGVVQRVGSARVLIIDEVSMLSADVLLMVDAVCREVRRNHEPFGGLQVVLVGDFFQLPPVHARDEAGEQESLMPEKKEMFAFHSSVWSVLKLIVCYLSEQHRQEDGAFLDLLSAIRQGTFSHTHRELLRSRYAKVPTGVGTELYAHNADVNRINDAALAVLEGQVRVFAMVAIGPEKLTTALKRGCLSPETLMLKIGARVMFTKNDVERRYVNGTLGIVAGFAKEGSYPIVETKRGKRIIVEQEDWNLQDAGKILAHIRQVPLRLAWAMTVHKSQGMSLDAAHMDLSNAFEYGQGYVALSRVRTLAGLSLAGLNTRALEVHPDVAREDAAFREGSQAARDTFAKTSQEEIVAMHTRFIRACGGSEKVMVIAMDAEVLETKPKKKRGATHEETKALIAQKLSLKEIAAARGMTLGTIVSHIETLAEEGKINPKEDLAHMERDPERFKEIKNALEAVFKKDGEMRLAPARELLGENFGFEEIRFVRLFVRFKKWHEKKSV